MNWIAFVTIAVISDSSRIFIDNYVSDFYFKGNGAVSQKLFYAYTSIIFSVILLHTLPDVKSVICGIVIVLGSIVAAGDIKEFLKKGKRT